MQALFDNGGVEKLRQVIEAHKDNPAIVKEAVKVRVTTPLFPKSLTQRVCFSSCSPLSRRSMAWIASAPTKICCARSKACLTS